MGIYPNRTTVPVNTRNVRTWIEKEDHYGWILQREVTATEWVEVERTTCYCCSCGEREGSDPYCRNHGCDGPRPCEVHNMPGSAGEDGVMPDSVQATNAKNKIAREVGKR